MFRIPGQTLPNLRAILWSQPLGTVPFLFSSVFTAPESAVHMGFRLIDEIRQRFCNAHAFPVAFVTGTVGIFSLRARIRPRAYRHQLKQEWAGTTLGEEKCD